MLGPMSATDPLAHIRLDDQGKAWIDDTKMKVLELVLDHVAYGWSAEEIYEQYRHLSLGQIHSALAYYYDHQKEIDVQIERDLEKVRDLRASTGEAPMQRRLRAAALTR